MSKVVITITDEGKDGDLDAVGVTLESEPDFPLGDDHLPEIDQCTAAQVAAYSVVRGLSGDLGASRMFTMSRESDVITEIDLEGS